MAHEKLTHSSQSRSQSQSQFAVRTIIVFALLLGVLVLPNKLSQAQSTANPIVLENQQPGSDAWKFYSFVGAQIADDVGMQIKGYASAVSVNKGENIGFHVSVSPAQNFTLDIYRMGYYGGKGARLLQSVGPIAGVQQPTCPIDASTGSRECDWSSSYSLNVPTNWTSGVYIVMLTNAQKFQNYMVFVVRDDSRTAEFLYQQPIFTYQAYNRFPNDDRTGKSLYDSSFGPPTIVGSTRAVKVSFNRPYERTGALFMIDSEFGWEQYFISWMERNGYDVSYSTNLDTHLNGARLRNYKAFLSLAHDEYWTREMFDAAVAARDNGVNLAFFGANSAYWQVRMEPSTSGSPNRTLVGYKNGAIDPIADPALKTILFRDLGRPEQTLVGVQYGAFNLPSQNTDLVVQNTDHWIYEGTGLTNGARVPAMVGYEVDQLMPNYPAPASIYYKTLATSPFLGSDGISTNANTSIYQAPSGACVFGAGTMSWSWSLDKPGYINAGIQQATKNIMDRFRGNCETAIVSTPTVQPTNPPVPTNTPVLTGPNLALNATGFRWFELPNPSSALNQTLDSSINDDNLVGETNLADGVASPAQDSYQAAGVLWSAPLTIGVVKFVNGSFTAGGDGVFCANMTLQFTSDGTTWTDSGWGFSPTYNYDTAAAASKTYSFGGANTSVLGARIVGQVHCGAAGRSWRVNVIEVQAFSNASTSTATPSIATNTPAPATPTNTVIPATATETPAAPTPTNTAVPATATETLAAPTPTNTPSVATLTPTRTPIPATATAIKTNTPVPSTATSTPVGPSVSSFTLINADTNQPIAGYDPIPNTATINLTALNTPRINVRANVSGNTQSVRFGLNGNSNYRVENIAPFALQSDDGNGNYLPWSPAAGIYDVTAVAFLLVNAQGQSSTTTAVRFSITYQTVATPTPLPTATPNACTPLVVPAGYAVFIFDNLNGLSNAQQSVAVGFDATLNSTTINGDLVVDHDVTASNGSMSGKLYFGNKDKSKKSFTVGGGTKKARPIDFATIKPQLIAQSDAYTARLQSGTLTFLSSLLRLTGTNSRLNVFNVPATTLLSTNSIIVDAPVGSRVLINVTGGTVTMNNLGIVLTGGVVQSQVLWNMSNAGLVTLNGISLPGSLLAPRASIQFTNGTVQGAVVGKQWNGSADRVNGGAPFCTGP